MLVAQVHQRRNALPSCPPAALESKLDWETQEYFENTGTQFPYADVRGRTLTYAHVCSRMLTYADWETQEYFENTGTQFPCFNGTKVQILVLSAQRVAHGTRVLGLRMLTDVCVCWHILTYADV